jgi:TatD DNase family protein
LENRPGKVKGVIHCFTGDWQEAQRYLAMGFYLGFNGIIFKLDLDEIIRKTPLDRILLETDCPYLTPPPMEGKRNEPLYVKYVAEKISQLKGISYSKIAEITTGNAKKLFKL